MSTRRAKYDGREVMSITGRMVSKQIELTDSPNIHG